MSGALSPDIAEHVIAAVCGLVLAIIAYGVWDWIHRIEEEEGRGPIMTRFKLRIRALWRRVKGYRTLIFNGVLGAWALLEAFDFTKLIDDPKKAAVAGLVVAAVGIWLRLATTGPVPSLASPPPDPKPSDIPPDGFDTGGKF